MLASGPVVVACVASNADRHPCILAIPGASLAAQGPAASRIVTSTPYGTKPAGYYASRLPGGYYGSPPQPSPGPSQAQISFFASVGQYFWGPLTGMRRRLQQDHGDVLHLQIYVHTSAPGKSCITIS